MLKIFVAPVSLQLDAIRRSLSLGRCGVRRVFFWPQLFRLGELFESDSRMPTRSRDELVSVGDQSRDLADAHVTVRIDFRRTWLQSGLQSPERFGGEAMLEKVERSLDRGPKIHTLGTLLCRLRRGWGWSARGRHLGFWLLGGSSGFRGRSCGRLFRRRWCFRIDASIATLPGSVDAL